MPTLEEVKQSLAAEMAAAYRDCPYAFLSRDYFARLSRDPDATPGDDEVAIGGGWRIVVPPGASQLAERMAGHLQEFLVERMDLPLSLDRSALDALGAVPAVVLLESGGGDPGVAESFTIAVQRDRVTVQGRDSEGLRDGVVKLVDFMGTRQAPFLSSMNQTYRPRLRVRLGVVPWMGTYRDMVFLGHNAVLLNTYFEGEESLYAVSQSDAIPELGVRRKPRVLEALIEDIKAAKAYGLKTFVQLSTRQKFPKDDPVFMAHPEIRGALTWKADGEYVLCTEHPLVRRYLMESVEGLFRAAPLDGVMFINGGESFYHCFMRSFGTAKGHTNCERCEPLGAETVVANLSNSLLEAARTVNPNAEVVAWPYSAEHVWSADRYQDGLIEKLRPGAGIFTEIEKDETVQKPEGVVKYIGDYSIDLIGPGQRALRQVAACRAAGVPIYIKSEPELGFEAPGLPYIPCLDRWAARAEALISCDPDGAWILPYFRAYHAGSSAEAFKFFWWDPAPGAEEALHQLARRMAGDAAAPHLREAWKHVSEAIDWSPEQPSYYTGPYYLGPAHPMCAFPDVPIPEVFQGRYLFMGEMTDAEGLRLRPTYVTTPGGNVPVFGRFYRNMADCLERAARALDQAAPGVPERCRRTFEAEESPIRWFYHTARTQANFYASCQIRDRLADQDAPLPDAERRALLQRWRAILLDEKDNAAAALPLVERDMRLDWYYGFDHTFPHAAEMLRAKFALLEEESARVDGLFGARNGE